MWGEEERRKEREREPDGQLPPGRTVWQGHTDPRRAQKLRTAARLARDKKPGLQAGVLSLSSGSTSRWAPGSGRGALKIRVRGLTLRQRKPARQLRCAGHVGYDRATRGLFSSCQWRLGISSSWVMRLREGKQLT